MTEFTPWPKIHRLFSEQGIEVTEKIDGTNSAVIIDDQGKLVGAQSRKRLITPDDDNHGFAAWAFGNAEALAEALGPGTHFGEWWGKGIQRGYGLDHQRFSLFNSVRWDDHRDALSKAVPELDVVPVLYRGEFSEHAVRSATENLHAHGSQAAPGFRPAEGVVVYFKAARTAMKFTPFHKNDGRRRK